MPTDTLHLPDHDPGEFPDWFTDPIDNPDLPWIVEASPEDYEHLVPPAERIAAEPHDVEVLPPLDPRERIRQLAPCAIAGINLRDYSKSPQGRGFGSACDVKLALVQLTEARISVDVRLAELSGLIMRANEAQGYLYRKADTGAYNCRKIAGTNQSSWHSWGVAIDANWQTNPYVSTWTTDRPEWERARWNRYGFAGGWDYTGGRRDFMHTEWMGTVAQIGQALELARRELLPIIAAGGGQAPAAPVGGQPAPSPASQWTPIEMGGVTQLHSTGEQVRRDQSDLNDSGFNCGTPDGQAGDLTIGAIRAAQQALFGPGADVDGKMGPNTRSRLHKVPSFPGVTTEAVRRPIPYSRVTKLYQDRLVAKRVMVAGAADGKHGPGTSAAFRAYQGKTPGLTVDGDGGPATWTALHSR